MLKIVKGLLLVAMALAVLFASGAYYLTRNLPSIVTEIVETEGSASTQTNVALGNIQFNFLSGKLTLSNLLIANPKGYKAAYAFELNSLVFHVDLPSLMDDVINIEELTISGVNITAEQVGASLKTNLQVIADNVERHSNKVNGTVKKQTNNDQEKTVSSGDENTRLIVKQFNFIENSVNLVSEQWGDRVIEIPDLVLNDVGAAEGGLTPEQLNSRVLELITQQASKALQEELKNLAKREAKKKVTGKIKEKLNSWFGN